MKVRKDRSVIDRYKSKVKEGNISYVTKNLQISNQISEILENKGLSQKEFAEMLGKHESEVSKLLSGLHNLTLKSIANMEAALEEDIILTPLEAFQRYSKVKYVTLKVYATKNSTPIFRNSFIQSDYKNCTEEENAA